MWKCICCSTENRTPRKTCHSCMAPKDVERLPLVVGCISIAFLIAFPATMIGVAYQIPTLIHYGAIAFLLTLGLALLGGSRSDQKIGVVGPYEFPIKKEESPIRFWFSITYWYAVGIVCIVVAIIAFFVPNFLL